MSFIPNYVIEGGDLTGKTTTQKGTLPFDVSKKYFIADRSILTRMMYNGYNHEWLIELVDFLANNGLIVLTATDETLKNRYAERGDEKYTIDKILTFNAKYRQFVELMSVPSVKEIPVDDLCKNEVVDKVVAFIENRDLEKLNIKIDNLEKLVYCMGESFFYPGRVSHELRNVRLKCYIDSFSDVKAGLEQNCNAKKEKISLLMRQGVAMPRHYTMDLFHSDAFYDAVFEGLKYQIMKSMHMNGISPLESRQFHFVCPQGSCLTSFGVTFRETESLDNVTMAINANIRSSDVVLLPFDVVQLARISEKLLLPKEFKTIFGSAYQAIHKRIHKVSMTLNFESVHVANKNLYESIR